MNRALAATRPRWATRWAGAVGLSLLRAGTAYGLEEGANTAGAAAGAALLHGANATGIGPGFEASASHGLTDVWAAHVSLAGQSLRFPGEAGRAPRWKTAFLGFAGLRVAYDVLRVIPFATFGASLANVTADGPTAGVWLGPEIGLGAEYLIDRQWSLAPALRVRMLPWRLSGDGATGTLSGADVALWVGRQF